MGRCEFHRLLRASPMRGAGGTRFIVVLLIILVVVGVLSRADFSGDDPQSRYAKSLFGDIGNAFRSLSPRRPPPVAKEQITPPEKGTSDLEVIAQAAERIGTPPVTEQSAGQGASIGIVKYYDADGNAHYVDSISKVPSEYLSSVNPKHNLPRITKTGGNTRSRNNPANAGKPGAGLRKTPAQSKKVEIYVTSWCPYCRKLEQFLKQTGIKFTRFDIEKDSAAAKRHKELGGGGVPVTKVGTEVIRGFSPEGIKAALR